MWVLNSYRRIMEKPPSASYLVLSESQNILQGRERA